MCGRTGFFSAGTDVSVIHWFTSDLKEGGQAYTNCWRRASVFWQKEMTGVGFIWWCL